MISFVIRWQLFLLKRQLRYFQNWFPLIMSTVIQMGVLLIFFLGGGRSLERPLGEVVLFMFLYSMPQAVVGYSTQKLATTQGIIGISPLPSSAKSAWVLLMLSINHFLSSFGVGLALGILVAIRLSPLGGLVIFPCAFVFFFGMPFGFSALLELVIKTFKPKEPQKVFALAGFLIMMLGFLSLAIFGKQSKPWLEKVGKGILDVGTLNTHAFPVVAAAMIIGIGGYCLRVVVTLRSQEEIKVMKFKSTSKIYRSKSAPHGLNNMLHWVEAIYYKRRRAEFIAPILMIFAFTFFQHHMWMSGVAIASGILGASQLRYLTGVKGLPLLFVAPVSLSKVWYSRIISSLPVIVAFWVLSLLVALASLGHLAVVEMVTSLAVAFASFIAASVVQFVFRSGDIDSSKTESPKKRRTVIMVLSMVFVLMAIPFGLATLSYSHALFGTILSLAIILSSFFTGRHLLNNSKPLRYLWAN